MREILFRGKRLDNGEWVFGGALHQTDYYGENVDSWYIIDGTCTNDYDIGYSYAVCPSTVCQYTGLKDKHGKKIFEGDILGSRYDKLYPDDVSIEVVQWFRNGWYIRQGKNLPDALDEYGVLPYSEVIGNIHDNLVLLKEEDET